MVAAGKNDQPLLAKVNVPRCYFSRSHHEGATLQLHQFCDASEVGCNCRMCIRYWKVEKCSKHVLILQ